MGLRDLPIILVAVIFLFMVKDYLGDDFYFALGIVFLIFIFRYGKWWLKRAQSFSKGDRAEQLIVDNLNEWSYHYDLTAFAYKFPLQNYHQHIDVLFDNSYFINLGIEVKFRTIDKLEYLTFNSISRPDRSGFRQSTRQLYSFISKTNRLGLYAFVFREKDDVSIYFLPHYVLQKMIDEGKYYIVIDKIKKHPESYRWFDENDDFHLYADTQFKKQEAFLKTSINPIEVKD